MLGELTRVAPRHVWVRSEDLVRIGIKGQGMKERQTRKNFQKFSYYKSIVEVPASWHS